MVNPSLNWLKKGARFSIKSAIFGFVTATVTDVEEASFSYRPETHNADFAVSMSKSNALFLQNTGEIKLLDEFPKWVQ